MSSLCDSTTRRAARGPGGRKRIPERHVRLRREVSATALDTWHLKGIVRALADGKTKLRSMDMKEGEYLDNLAAETESLYETVNNSKDEVKALIELHINLKSFEMNGFLRLLAVILGLIPSVVGLLGMNVAGIHGQSRWVR